MDLIQRVRSSAGREGRNRWKGRTTAFTETIKGVKDGAGGEKNAIEREDLRPKRLKSNSMNLIPGWF